MPTSRLNCTAYAAAAILILTSAAPPAATIPARSSDAFPAATPESQGLSSEALAGVADVVRGYLERDMIVGGELLIIKNRRTVLHEVFGRRDREQGEEAPWTIGTICNIRSMSKPLTGAAAQILIDRGKLALDEPVAKYLPGFDTDAARLITVGQLMEHRSGLPLTILSTAIDQFPTLQEQANATGAGGPEFEPGSKFWYSDAGSDALGAVVEVVSGMPLDEFVTGEILAPLGMAESFYALDATDPRFPRIASLYIGTAHAWTRFWTPKSGEPLYPCAWGSQTLYSTPVDYAKFLAMWMDGGTAGARRILSPEAVERTLTPVSEMTMLGNDQRFPTDFLDLEVYYGRMSVLHVPTAAPTSSKPVVIGHSGSDGTVAWAWPEDDLMILYFTQSRGGTTVLRIEPDLERLLLHPGRVVVAEEVPERYEPYVGIYIANFASFENEPFEVRMQNGRLALDIPSQMVFELLDPDEEGRWHFALTDTIKVSFDAMEDGKATLLKLYQGPMVFEVPRQGTKLAAEMSKLPTVDPETVRKVLGTYHDPEADHDIEVLLQDDVLCIKAPPGMVFHLRPTKEPNRWQVKQMPIIFISFEFDDDGNVVSVTRHIQDETLVMPRVERD